MATGARSSPAYQGIARVVVVFHAPFDGWDLPPYEAGDGRIWIHGGERTLLEIAAAAASAGHVVELRGHLVESEVASIEASAGVTFERPVARRAARVTDVVIVPEGMPDPLLFARIALSPARAILAVLGAPGLFGWAFDRGDARPDPLTVDPASVGRPEQLEAARSFGFELWTNLRGIADQAQALGIQHHYIAVGRPAPYPEPPAKEVDVATMADNKWVPLVNEILAALRPSVSTVQLPAMPRDELLRAVGTARILIHPVRIEGRSRVCEEARAMRTVPVMLTSNHLAEGLRVGEGGVGVERLEEIAPTVHALLDDPGRLAGLADAGYRDGRRVGDWGSFVARVAGALANPDAGPARFAAGRAALGARLHAAELERRSAEDQLRREQAALQDELASELVSADDEARALHARLEEAGTRYLALRSRKIVRAGLRATSLLDRLRPNGREGDRT